MAERYEQRPVHGVGVQRLLLAAGVAVLLLLPMVAMRFTEAVDWTAYDFAAAALLLGGGAIAYDMVTRVRRGMASRVMAGAVITLLVAFIWAQGAVGIF